jgi:hypothetical protein
VFWGGREGYFTLLNTDYAKETTNFARLLRLAVDYKKKIRFKGREEKKKKRKKREKRKGEKKKGKVSVVDCRLNNIRAIPDRAQAQGTHQAPI